MKHAAWIAAFVSGLPALSFGGQPSTDYDWVTIGAPGNRSANQREAPYYYPPWEEKPIIAGGVDYEYRIMRTELNNTQWLEFCNAYWPFLDGNPDNPYLLGHWLRAKYNEPGKNPEYYIVGGAENFPATMSFHYAARFANWLTNDKRFEKAAFENGAYDTSTFTMNPDGTWNDQQQHSPGAKFWIPTLSEWTKAMYYDPNRYGPGEEGYWLYEHGSDTPPISGWPWEGGETSAGLELFSGPYLDVGSYPDTQSPWGLLDGSGGVIEWTEYMSPLKYNRGGKGARQFFPQHEYFDRLDVQLAQAPNSAGFWGIRLVTTIPAPSIAPTMAIGVIAFLRRRR